MNDDYKHDDDTPPGEVPEDRELDEAELQGVAGGVVSPDLFSQDTPTFSGLGPVREKWDDGQPLRNLLSTTWETNRK